MNGIYSPTPPPNNNITLLRTGTIGLTSAYCNPTLKLEEMLYYISMYQYCYHIIPTHLVSGKNTHSCVAVSHDRPHLQIAGYI